MTRGTSFDFNLFRAIEVFAAVVETRQVTRAAKLLGITQSAASQHLKSLEQALGTRLLDRGARPIEPTRAGKALHRRALRILGEVEDLQTDVRRLESAPIPVLRIGCLASIATTLTPTLVELARARFEIPEVAVFAGLASDHQDLLRNRGADIVITSDALYDVDGLERHLLLHENFLLVLPPGHDGPACRGGDLARLTESLPLVRFSAGTPAGRLTDQHLRRLRLEIPRGIEADRSSMIVSAVAAGQGFAILTPSLLVDGFAEGHAVELRPLPAPGFSRSLTLVARSRELGSLPKVFAAAVVGRLEQAFTGQLPVTAREAVRWGE